MASAAGSEDGAGVDAALLAPIVVKSTDAPGLSSQRAVAILNTGEDGGARQPAVGRAVGCMCTPAWPWRRGGARQQLLHAKKGPHPTSDKRRASLTHTPRAPPLVQAAPSA